MVQTHRTRLRQFFAALCLAVPALAPASAQTGILNPILVIAPGAAVVTLGSSVKFSALAVGGGAVSGAVTWQVNGITGGNATVGTIAADGTYTAPASVPGISVFLIHVAPSASMYLPAYGFAIVAPRPPVITSVEPGTLNAGPFTLLVNGSDFTRDTVVFMGSSALLTTYLSPVNLRISGALAAPLPDSVALVPYSPAAYNPTPQVFSVPVNKGATGAGISDADAHRFLRQATFGPTAADIARLKQMGYQAFLDDQFAVPASTYPDSLLNKSLDYTVEQFFRHAMSGQDQLLQKTAFALHKIFVVSGVQVDCAEAFVPYYRLMTRHAFGNFYDLMKDVTLNAAMGEYLNMVNNKKGDPAKGIMPNENYARELLQLFTVGLVKLNTDGTAVTNFSGPVPAYGQSEVLELARVFTGWTYGDNRATPPTGLNSAGYYDRPMEVVAKFHDTGQKTLLDGYVIPANLDPDQELELALRHIFNHPNVPPFISKQLIQMLVTSNPTPAYVQRVANAFRNNGAGVRGDMKAVLKAILLDEEAKLTTPNAGKLREPVLFITSILRALGGTVKDAPFMSDFSASMSQNVFYPPSVFSYFAPGYVVGGTGLLGPEFQLYNSETALVRANFVANLLAGKFSGDITISYTDWNTAAANIDTLLEKINATFFGGQMETPLRDLIRNSIPATTKATARLRAALFLALASNQYQVEH